MEDGRCVQLRAVVIVGTYRLRRRPSHVAGVGFRKGLRLTFFLLLPFSLFFARPVRLPAGGAYSVCSRARLAISL